jgi:formylglycine-generating enzyme required for sulfatase activity
MARRDQGEQQVNKSGWPGSNGLPGQLNVVQQGDAPMKWCKLLMVGTLVLLMAACAGQVGQTAQQGSQTEVELLASTAIAEKDVTLQAQAATLQTSQAQVSASQTALAVPTPTGTFTPQPTITPTVTPTGTPMPINKPAQTDPLVLALAPGVEIQLVRVPAGEFLMGSGDSQIFGKKDEKPQHTVYLDEYLIGKFEVTVAQFRVFMQVTGFKFAGAKTLPEGQDNYPVTWIYYEQAEEFAKWLSEWTGRKVTLPTEAQWEKATRGTDGRLYPWGDIPLDCVYANASHCSTGLQPVGSHPQGASPYGAQDMVGNVLEMCSDYYADNYYAVSPANNPTGPKDGIPQVWRGGDWQQSWDRSYASYRQPGSYDFGYVVPEIGFRVVVAVD